MSHQITRRTFSQVGTTAAVALATARTAQAAEQVRLGVIGVGNRGSQLVAALQEHRDAEIVAVCDVYQPYLDRAKQRISGSLATYTDYRKMLERKDLDAIVVATPDHWHALQMIHACQSGRDVYVEKPLSITVVEGRKMVEAARRYNRVVQVGTQRRSTRVYKQLVELVRAGKVGKVSVASAYRLSNMYPNGIGSVADAAAPKDLDWDMWLGPRPARAFNANIAPYKFRWHKAYSSQVANWGAHYFDAMRWVLDETAPTSLSVHGGKYAVQDDRDVPDTLHATFEFASGALMIFGQYEASGNKAFPSGQVEFRGTLGTVYAGQRGYEILPERGGQFQDRTPRLEPVSVRLDEGDTTVLHMRNFLDCVKSRKRPNADIEIGHRSTTFALLANIALATRARLDWDAERERFTNNEAANKLLHYTYRAPWKLPES